MTEPKQPHEVDAEVLAVIARLPVVLAPNILVLATNLGPQVVLGDAMLPGPPNFFTRVLIPVDAAEKLVDMLTDAITRIKTGSLPKGVLNS